jgi:hypothetical protein
MVEDFYISGFEVVVTGEGSLLLSDEIFHRLALAKISGASSPGWFIPKQLSATSTSINYERCNLGLLGSLDQNNCCSMRNCSWRGTKLKLNVPR